MTTLILIKTMDNKKGTMLIAIIQLKQVVPYVKPIY